MIAVLWALLGVMGYIAVAAVAFVYREDTWMRLLPSRLRHVAHKDRLAGVFAASTGLYENPDEDPASPTPTGPEPAKCEHGQTEGHSFYVAEGRDWDHPAEHATCPGPATPEPTEETLRCQEPTCPDFGDPDFGEATCPSDHAEENR